MFSLLPPVLFMPSCLYHLTAYKPMLTSQYPWLVCWLHENGSSFAITDNFLFFINSFSAGYFKAIITRNLLQSNQRVSMST